MSLSSTDGEVDRGGYRGFGRFGVSCQNAAAGRTILTPSTDGRWVKLRPVGQADYNRLYSWATEGQNALRYRFQGATPRPEQFVDALWRQVLYQVMIVGKTDGVPVGHVSIYDPDFRHGTAYLAVLFPESSHGSGWPIEGLKLALDHVFRAWDIGKIYLETPEFNIPNILSALDGAYIIEGRLRDHYYLMGQRWDLCIGAIYRAYWLDRESRTCDAEYLDDADSSRTSASPLDFEQFCRLVNETLVLDLDPSCSETPKLRLVDDLGMDSLSVYELAELLASIGAAFPEELLETIETVDDVFHYASTISSHTQSK